MTVLSAAEKSSLTSLLGAPVVDAEIMFERWHVVRVSLADGRTVVVKRPRAADDQQEPLGMERELASLSLLAEMPSPVAPRLLGSDDSLFVLEELPPGRTLAEVLLYGTRSSAQDALAAYAASLAEIHAFTQGRTVPGLDRTPIWAQRVLAASSFGSAAERAEVARLLSVPSAQAVLVHGDPCPDNIHIASDDGRAWIIDYERTSFGAAVLDIAYLIAPWPSCWCFATLPPDVGSAALDAYRSVRPLGDQWERELAAALAGFLAFRTGVFDQPDLGWGTTTWAPRLRAWTEAFLATPASAEFPALRADAGALRDGLPATPLVAYPAFPADGYVPVLSPEGWLPTPSSE